MITYPNIDWNKLRSDRRIRVAQLMKELNLDHILLQGYDNIRYATDFRAQFVTDSYEWFLALVDDQAESTLFVGYLGEDIESPDPNRPWIKRQLAVPCFNPIWANLPIWIKLIVSEIRRENVKRIGVELLNFEVYEALKKELPDVEFVPVANELLKIRETKTLEEIQLLETSSEILSLAFATATSQATEGMIDHEIASILAKTIHANCGEMVAHNLIGVFPIQALTDPRLPQGDFSFYAQGQRLWGGMSVEVDFGVTGPGGYHSDMARHWFINEPPAAVQKAWNGLLEAYRFGIDQAKPGMKISTIAKNINSTLKKLELPETLISMGHGIGLRIAEAPFINSPEMMSEDKELLKGMTICIEPETLVDINGAPFYLKVEDVFVVEENGLRNLSRCGYSLESP
ncbi:MAG: aminopeptidase P family protein [Deltaproteobacteria bacterium]|jgi:Xaa-Pro dipeptidase|nr:aminopeptidase P family protein [Deltaproteobacteria bacterium]MBT4089102.1 aminopeptidase P family protein [Deltaproteobacteria bacterium]MBT4269536.1 aminopeptidase P family protein [Deltaproteobacteria bacterium]MBT4642621.1 aminopeptidase P family protein [Deltaproteobacteria bacterium]MBT6501284.1 aminopeptidase P family protein [Deltaproteobacteria bacterium]